MMIYEYYVVLRSSKGTVFESTQKAYNISDAVVQAAVEAACRFKEEDFKPISVGPSNRELLAAEAHGLGGVVENLLQKIAREGSRHIEKKVK